MSGDRHPDRRIVLPAAAAGLLMAAYLVVRPYGDAAGPETAAAAEAFAAPAWIVAHACGALALASFAWFAVLLARDAPGRSAATAAAAGFAGVVLVLPYYGAETFGLHAIGRAATGGDESVLELVDQVRNQPVAVTAFGAGLLLLAVSGVLAAVVWQRERRSVAAWPLGILVALVLPQFFLPPWGRMFFGVLCAVVGLVFAAAVYRGTPSDT